MSESSALVSRALSPGGSGHSAFAITPHNTNQLAQNGRDVVVRAIYVGAGGHITGQVWTESGTSATVLFSNVAAGTVLHIAFTHIHVLGTTASGMVGLL